MCIGYRLVSLQGGQERPLALTQAAFRGQFQEACRLGPFVFSAKAFSFANEHLLRLCSDAGVDTLFLDEAGPLELRGEGFAPALPALLGSGKALCVAVRTGCLTEFLARYDIRDYELISVSMGAGAL